MRIILYILIVGLFISCNSAKQAVNSINKGFNQDSVAAAKRVRQIVPCITTKQDTVINNTTNTIHDTTLVVKDSLITLPCPDGTTVSTTIKIVTKNIRTVTTVTKKYYITKIIEDKGKDIIIRDYKRQLVRMESKKEFWMVAAIIFVLILIFTWVGKLILKSLPGR